jgi:hypothetical protein
MRGGIGNGATRLVQQFSLWPWPTPAGRGRPAYTPTRRPSYRLGALTRWPHVVHNEQAKCYRTWQGRITYWGILRSNGLVLVGWTHRS